MAKISVPEFDAHGVVVDQDRTGNVSGQLTKAQNAIADPLGEKGSIHKRPGLKAINGTAGNGTVRGGIGVPRLLGSAGPDMANPFTDITVTITQYTTPTVGTGGTSSTGYVQRLGTTFDDESFYYLWDWNNDFAEFDPNTIYGDIDDLYDVTGDGDPILKVPNAVVNTIVPVTLFGDTLGFWYVALDTALAQDADSTTTYTDTQTLIFPTGSVRAYNGSGSGSGGQDDSAYPLVTWFVNGQGEDGYPTCILNNVLYYAAGSANYTVGTNNPPLRSYDGYTDKVVAYAPLNQDVSSSAPPKAIVSLLAANNRVYFSTFDGGSHSIAVTSMTRAGTVVTTTTTAAHGLATGDTISVLGAVETEYNITAAITVTGATTFTFDIGTTPTSPATGTITVGSAVKGSVYEIDPATTGVIKLGSTFPTGHIPYALCWAYGRLWCGTAVNRNESTAASRIYYFRPDIDTSWTLDETFSANEGICMALASFQGRLFAALNFNSAAGGTARVMVRATTGTWSASDTGTVPAAAGNYDSGYMSLLVWPPEDGSVTSPASALFATRRAITGDAGTGALRKFNGTSWSTVHTWDYDASGTGHLESTYTINSSNTPVPTLWVTRGTLLYNSTNGTSWTDRTAGVPAGATNYMGSAGFGGLVLQLTR